MEAEVSGGVRPGASDLTEVKSCCLAPLAARPGVLEAEVSGRWGWGEQPG